MASDLSCDLARDLLPSYADGLLSDASKAAVEAHLAQCEDCRRALDAMLAPMEPLPVDTPEVRSAVARCVEPLLGKGIDTVVLGCTHFPLLARQIREAMGGDVRIVSSAEETCREVREILERREELSNPESVERGVGDEPSYRFATTSDDITSFAVAGRFIFGHQLDSVEHISLEELDSLVATPKDI